VPDEATGERVVAYVVADAGAPDDLASRIRTRCAERLAGFKQPSRVELVDALPHTATGKVQKGRLRTLERRRRTGLLE
jgi:long-chain acyl-CoA synthetase